MLLKNLNKIFPILVGYCVYYVIALFDNIDIVNVFDYESDVFFEIKEPKELKYTYRIRPATNFGIPLNDTIETFESKLVPTDPAHCCTIPTNTHHLYGNIALVERGSCTFKRKAVNAEEAGAIGIIISDFDYASDMYIDMLDDESVKDTNIPAAFLLGKSGQMIASTLKRLNRIHAHIHIPLNLTKLEIRHQRQPPWLIW